MPGTPIAIIGGGAFAPKLCEALAREAGVPPLDLRLAARRVDRLTIIGGHASRRLEALQSPHRVTACATLREAVASARVVVLLVRVGGHTARSHDEEFPRAFGQVGDEGLGVGGIANAYRTLPVLADIAKALRACAPEAPILNLMAPLGMTTRMLLDAGCNALGLCELPEVTLEKIAAAAGAAPDSVEARYGGLNHLGWFWDVHSGDRDVLGAAREAGLVDANVLENFGAAPLHYYYDVFNPAAAKRLGRARTAGRAMWLEALSDRLVERFSADAGGAILEADERPTPWFHRAVAPVVRALLGGRPHRGFVNVRNRGLLAELPEETVVEVRATVDASGASPVAPGELPVGVARFLQAVARAEGLAFRAARERSVGRVEEAIRALPLGIGAVEAAELARRAVLQVG